MVCLQTQTWHHNLFECNCTTNRAPSLAAIPAGVSGARHFSYSTDIFASIIGISLFILFFFSSCFWLQFSVFINDTVYTHLFFFWFLLGYDLSNLFITCLGEGAGKSL